MSENQNKKIINIGLDVGITSLGWVITNEKLEIIERGVRLFDSTEDPKSFKLLNEQRREKRSSRRLKARKITRKRDWLKFLVDNQVIDIEFKCNKSEFISNYTNSNYFDSSLNILELRNKVLNGVQLNKTEFLSMLYWYLSNRGFTYEVIGEDLDKVKAKQRLDDLGIDLRNDKYPAVSQLKIFNEIGYFIGIENRAFSNDNYQDEIKEIFNKQSFDSLDINISKDAFRNKFLEIFSRQRSYEVGPGNEKNTSPYGVWYKDENGQVKKYASLWEKPGIMATDYRGETSAPKGSHEAELFNLIQDLNNIRIKTDSAEGWVKLDSELKRELIKSALEYEIKTSNENEKTYSKKFGILSPAKVVKFIFDYYKISTDEFGDLKFNDAFFKAPGKAIDILSDVIKGFRISGERGKSIMLITSLNFFHDINSHLLKNGISESELFKSENFYPWDIVTDSKEIHNSESASFKDDKLSKIALVFHRTKSLESRKEKLAEFISDQKLIDALASFDKFPSSTHSLSSLSLLIESKFLIDSNQNHMEFITNNNFSESDTNFAVNGRRINKSWINNLAASPTVKRSLHQTIGVMNAILKKYKQEEYQYKNVVIEMPREKNSANRKRLHDELMNFNKKRRDQILNSLEDHFPEEVIQKMSNGLLAKIELFREQDRKDFYTGEDIDIRDLVYRSNEYDIDHAIPISKSFVDAKYNKVLTLSKYNSEKSNKTPYQYLGFDNYNRMYNDYWKKWYANNKRKLEFVSSKANFDDVETLEFINRNLNDTRYIARSLLNSLTHYFHEKEKQYDEKTLVKTTVGQLTNFVRKLISRYENDKENRLATNFGELKRPEGFEHLITDKDGSKYKNRDWNGHHSEDAYFSLYNALVDPRYSSSVSYALDDYKIMHGASSDESTNRLAEDIESFNIRKGKNIYSIEDMKFLVEQLNATLYDVKFSRYSYAPKNLKLHDETLYTGTLSTMMQICKQPKLAKKSSKKNDEEEKASNAKNDVCVIKYVRLDSDSDLFDKNKIKKNVFLNPDNESKVLMFHYDKKGWNELKDLYVNHLDLHKNNPFMSDEFKSKYGFPKIHNKVENDEIISSQTVKGIRIIYQENKDTLWVKKVKSLESKSKISFYDSMDWVAILLFLDSKKKYKIIPLTTLNYKMGENFERSKYINPINDELPNVDMDALKDQKEFLDIPLDNKPIFAFIRGDIFRVFDGKNEKLLYLNGHNFKQYKLTLKTLDGSFINVDPGDDKQGKQVSEKPITLNKGLLNSEVFTSDLLGNLKKIFVFGIKSN